MEHQRRLIISLLLVVTTMVNGDFQFSNNITNGPNDINFKAYTPFYLNFDRLSFRAALDTGLELLNENKTILPGYKLHIHYKDDEVRLPFPVGK